jgi:hypothetical protein
VIEKRAFAGLETAENGHVNTADAAIELFSARGNLRLEVCQLQLGG